jgi:hypothetical protein
MTPNPYSQDICAYLADAYLHDDFSEIGKMIESFQSQSIESKSVALKMHHSNIHRLFNDEMPNSLRVYAVIPGVLYAGEIPSSIHDGELQTKILALQKLGITHVFNLTEEDEKNFKGIPLRDYTASAVAHYRAANKELTCQRFPIEDLNIPTFQHMQTILNAMNAAISAGGVVYVHCWGGVGRTGTVIGCFLAEMQILSVDTVIPYIAFLKRNTEIKHRNSPETEAQCQFILNWP